MLDITHGFGIINPSVYMANYQVWGFRKKVLEKFKKQTLKNIVWKEYFKFENSLFQTWNHTFKFEKSLSSLKFCSSSLEKNISSLNQTWHNLVKFGNL